MPVSHPKEEGLGGWSGSSSAPPGRTGPGMDRSMVSLSPLPCETPGLASNSPGIKGALTLPSRVRTETLPGQAMIPHPMPFAHATHHFSLGPCGLVLGRLPGGGDMCLQSWLLPQPERR